MKFRMGMQRLGSRAGLALALSIFALGGCSRAKLELNPAVLAGCAAGHGEVVRVSWDASNSGTKGVEVYIRRPGGTKRPWTRGKAVGSRETGRWASDGLTFILRDDHGRELARRTIETRRCPRRQKYE